MVKHLRENNDIAVAFALNALSGKEPTSKGVRSKSGSNSGLLKAIPSDAYPSFQAIATSSSSESRTIGSINHPRKTLTTTNTSTSFMTVPTFTRTGALSAS